MLFVKILSKWLIFQVIQLVLKGLVQEQVDTFGEYALLEYGENINSPFRDDQKCKGKVDYFQKFKMFYYVALRALVLQKITIC